MGIIAKLQQVLGTFIGLTLFHVGYAANAVSPVGTWQTIDDESGKPHSWAEISQTPAGFSLLGRSQQWHRLADATQ